MKTPAKAFIGALLATAIAASAASAGVVVVVHTESLGGARDAGGTAELFIEPDRIRINSTEGGGNISIIYRTDNPAEPIYWVIDHQNRTYYEITRRDMEEIRSRIDQARKTFEEQMKNVPPDRREDMRKVFLDQLGAAAAPAEPATYARVARGITVNEWVCDQYEGYRGGVKAEEVWAADWKNLGIRKSSLSALYQMSDLFQNVGQEMPAFFQFGKFAQEDPSVDGFPILVVSYVDGVMNEKSEVKNIARKKLDAALFSAPEGFRKMAASGP